MRKMLELAKSVNIEYPLLTDLIVQIDLILDKIFCEKPTERLKSRVLAVNKFLQFTREPNQSVQLDLHLATCVSIDETISIKYE